MSTYQNSPFLDEILQKAKDLSQQSGINQMTREHILVAALMTIARQDKPDAQEEYNRTRQVLQSFTVKEEHLQKLLDSWKGKKASPAEAILLSTLRSKAIAAAKADHLEELTADCYLTELLRSETPGMKKLKRSVVREEEQKSAPASPEAGGAPDLEEGDRLDIETGNRPDSQEQEVAKPGISNMIAHSRDLRRELLTTVLGQQHAVNTFVEGYFQSELQASIEEDRKRPRATFLFAGPPGVGKTFLSEEAARILKLPFRRFDMSEYAGPNATDELSGSDANYKASAEGLLTGFVARNDRCVLLFDEIEKASLDVIHLFLQVLDAGQLRDNRTDKEVSFKDAILIFTTNAGKPLYEEQEGSLSTLSRDVILDALARDENPKTHEPFFPAAICSRFAAGNVVMFDHLGAHALCSIVENRLRTHTEGLKQSLGVEVTLEPEVSRAILYAEGAGADARMVKSRADAFFGRELYELFRLLPSQDAVERIRIGVELNGAEETIQRLFAPTERVHALSYGTCSFQAQDILIPELHRISSMQEAKEILERENVQLALCDLFSEESKDKSRFLNREDWDTPARQFLFDLLEQYPDLSVLLTHPQGKGFTEEEAASYYRRGVRGILSLEPEGLDERIRSHVSAIVQQNSLTELARSNRLVSFETGQTLSEDGKNAEIVLFDFRLRRAVKAEDSDNILSMFSTPDVRFADVIGAEDAKKELNFFVRYMNNPKRYRKQGASAPKGVLLYGPPGTGKTMLAKAFAAESHATFLALEGNQFYKGIVGQGAAMVHRVFASARRYAPSVIFIDEIDTIARARTGRDTDLAQDSEQILTALFAEMDGFVTNPAKPVFVLGATNYSVEAGAKMSLDPAMLRRFDRRILIDLPTLEGRKTFLRRETERKELFALTAQGIDSLADRSTGMSVAQLSSVLDLAIRRAMQDEAEHINDDMLEDAFETFTSGESRKWSQEILLRTARHEAGHAVVSWLSGEKPSYVTIVSRGNYGGYMQYANQEERFGFRKDELLSRIRTAMGGRAAELVYYGKEDGLTTGASGDLAAATRLATQMICSYGMDAETGMAVTELQGESLSEPVRQRINEMLTQELEAAVQLISNHREEVDALVEQLLQSNSLRGEQIEKILSRKA